MEVEINQINKDKMPKILVNSLPKSGTHLLLQIILGIPGMIITPAWIVEEKDLKLFTPGSVGPGHLIYSAEQVNLLKNNNIKTVFISRYLRDVAVSLVHFVMLNKWGNHPWTPYLKDQANHDDRLMTMIKGVKLTPAEQKKYGVHHIPSIREFSENKLGWIKEPTICSYI